GYRQTNQKTDTGKTLTRWPVFVDHFTSIPKAKAKKTSSSNEIRLIDYTEKAFVVVGDTNDYAEQLKELSGKWITVRWGGKAWMFSKKRLNEVSELLDLAPEMLSEDEAL
ncbi:hypothetical protein ACVPW9_19730, partial [Klebsiella pneumoniae]